MLELSRRTKFALLGLLVCLASAPRGSGAEGRAAQEMRSLDEQVQEIKSDVGIAAELNRLEERPIYPSDAHLAIFVSIAGGQTFRLDAMQINIDGSLAAHFIYGFKELEALQNGGTQLIYAGSLPTGAHELVVSVNGKTQNGSDFRSSETFAFNKGVEPTLLGISLAGPETIQLGEW